MAEKLPRCRAAATREKRGIAEARGGARETAGGLSTRCESFPGDTFYGTGGGTSLFCMDKLQKEMGPVSLVSIHFISKFVHNFENEYIR